jgi:hypothetical protein
VTDARALAGRLRYLADELLRRGEVTKNEADEMRASADAIDRLAAPEGVGLMRYSISAAGRDSETDEPWARFVESDDGEWVDAEDAAVAIAAEKARADEADAKLLKSVEVNLIAIREKNAAEAERDALKAALETADALIEGWIEGEHILCSKDPDDYGRWTAHVARCADRAALSKTQGGE